MRACLRPLTFAALASLTLDAGNAAAEDKRGVIRFLHFNDSYRVLPVRGWGGMAELATLIKRQREAATLLKRPVVVTHGGDLISPSLLSSLTKGRHMIELVNMLGMNVAVLGNHEFDHGPDVLRKRMMESRFPWLATNILGDDGKPFGSAVATAVAQIGKFKVGFFGVVTPESRKYIRGGAPVRFTPYLPAARAAVARLRAQGAEVIVALTHLNLSEDIVLARNVRGIHLILGGHDHMPVQFLIGSTLVLKSGSDATYLGVIDLGVTKRGGRVGVVPQWSLLAVRDLPPDPAVKAVVDRYVAAMEKQLGGVIGHTSTALDSRASTVRTRESAIGNLIADAVLAATNADVALMNGGGIRGNRTYPAGHALTAKDILAELPFNNTIVVVEAKGKHILDALEHGLSRAGSEQGRFPHVAGMKVRYDTRRKPGARVVSLTIGDAPVDPEKTYRLAVNDFLAGGGDGYDMFRDLKQVVTEANGPAITNTVIEFVKAKKTVAPRVEGRLVAIP